MRLLRFSITDYFLRRILHILLSPPIQISETLVPKSSSNMEDEVFHLGRLFEHLKTNEINGEERRALEIEVSREYPNSHRHDQLTKTLDVVMHFTRCRTPHCKYPNCGKTKALYRHLLLCKRRALGACPTCYKMWHVLQVHARACKDSKCNVPRCRDLKEHMLRLASLRRAAKAAESSTSEAKLPELVKKALELTVHIFQCESPCCEYPVCAKGKGRFHHSKLCITSFERGCDLCKEMWVLLQLHYRACKESNCNVPQCRESKEQRMHSKPRATDGVDRLLALLDEPGRV